MAALKCYPIEIVILGLLLILPMRLNAQANLTPEEILDNVDRNIISTTVVYKSQMVIHQRNRVDTKEMSVWGKGKKNSFVEFTAPARDRGVKYLRLEESLWMYLPNIEKVIKISGHLLRQSMMGSDFSYEDSLDRIRLREDYHAVLLDDEMYDGKLCYVLDMIASRKDVTYYRRKTWIDKEQFIGIKSELYAKTGKLLKVMTVPKIEFFQGRYYPMHIVMQDLLRKDSRTELFITEIEFDVDIPENIFSMRNLERR